MVVNSKRCVPCGGRGVLRTGLDCDWCEGRGVLCWRDGEPEPDGTPPTEEYEKTYELGGPEDEEPNPYHGTYSEE